MVSAHSVCSLTRAGLGKTSGGPQTSSDDCQPGPFSSPSRSRQYMQNIPCLFFHVSLATTSTCRPINVYIMRLPFRAPTVLTLGVDIDHSRPSRSSFPKQTDKTCGQTQQSTSEAKSHVYRKHVPRESHKTKSRADYRYKRKHPSLLVEMRTPPTMV